MPEERASEIRDDVWPALTLRVRCAYLIVMPNSLGSYIEHVRGEFEAKLREWVEIPTVSSSPDHRSEIDRGVNAAVQYLRQLGAQAAVVQTPGNPVVWGRFETDPAHPTATVYNHLDVQPANEPEWKSDPFQMRIESDTYIGRGTTDDKGPALAALMGARYSVENGIPLNIHFIWEFEEEIGSPNFENFIKTQLADLQTDSVVISDTIWLSRDRPAIPFGLRGLLTIRVYLETGTRDVHSGLTGGVARNPLNELCTLIADCYDRETGRVAIPGFYDNVLPPDEEIIQGFVDSGFNPELFREAHGLIRMKETQTARILRRLWTRPTFEVHGIVGGYTGPGVKTSIPPRAEAKISMRLVPDQSPHRQFGFFAQFLKERNPDVDVELDSMLAPFLGSPTGPYAEAASEAMRTAFGKDPASIREGGSIGAVVTMRDYLKVPILFLGLSLPEHGYHSANENFDWSQTSGGIRMFARYFENLSKLPGKTR